MTTRFRKSFERDLKRIADSEIRSRIRRAIEAVEAAAKPADISELKKLAGAAKFYRIRVADYRLGIIIDGETVEFVRCLPRRDLYRFFP